jgi:hypothetical protein
MKSNVSYLGCFIRNGGGRKNVNFKTRGCAKETSRRQIFFSNNERAMDSIPTILPSKSVHLIPTQARGWRWIWNISFVIGQQMKKLGTEIRDQTNVFWERSDTLHSLLACSLPHYPHSSCMPRIRRRQPVHSQETKSPSVCKANLLTPVTQYARKGQTRGCHPQIVYPSR